MSELLSATDKANFQLSILDIFDTFQKEIKIHKEAIKTVVAVNSDSTLPGYNETSNIENYKLTPVSKEFNALVSYNKRQETGVADEVGVIIPEGQVQIKVQQAARDYIMNGKTEKIEFDDKSFNLISRDSVRDYFGMKIYIFILEEAV